MKTGKRCPWPTDEMYCHYHDTEWGVPLHDDQKLFEFIVLEGAQAGLSWRIILNKRETYRKAFAQFDSLGHMDGAAGETHEEDMWVLLHVAGDDNFAKLFAGKSSEVREGYGEFLVQCGIPFFSNAKPYIKLHFPKTYAILYGR